MEKWKVKESLLSPVIRKCGPGRHKLSRIQWFVTAFYEIIDKCSRCFVGIAEAAEKESFL